MALNIAYNQTYSYLADAATINQAARTILQNAEQKNATNQEKASVFEMNFKANDAIRQAVISNAALQLTLDANLKETLKFLNSEAAKKIINKSKSFITLETAKTSDKENSSSQNQYTGEFLELMDYEIDENTVNIFAV
ncbi:hypothetical protein IJI31_02025 [bacterium]|nr:hypothetical protein [bacterium]